MMIFNYFVMVLMFSTVFLSGVVPNTYAFSIVAVTDNGSTFPIIIEDSDNSQSSSSNGTSSSSTNATSVLNGFGITSLIWTDAKLGQSIWGTGVIGTAESLTPYTITNSSANFAAVVLDYNTKNTYVISNFWGEHSYDENTDTLTDVTQVLPNILGYSESRDLSGTNSISISNGIVVDGNVPTILKLNNYANDRIILTGTLDAADSNVQLMTQATTDLMSATYGANGFTVPSSLPAVVGVDSTHYATASWTSGYTYRSQSCAGPVNGYYYVATSYTPYSSSSTVTVTITETNEGDHKLITSLSGYSATAPASTGGSVWAWCQFYLNSGIQDGWVSGVTLAIYDTLPAYTQLDYSASFVEDYTFPAEQTYLYVDPNGGTVTILGQEVASTPTLVIDNLPASISWQISKDGWIIASGVTSATGNITISEDDVSFEGFSIESGLLHLYPDSLSYRGAFTTICFDTENKEIFHVTDSYDQMCVPSAFVSLPISMDVEINEISSGTVTFDYLAGNYTAGDSVSVPIIPQMKTIAFTLNGVSAEINIKDITNTAQSKILSTVTNSDTLYATGSAIENIEVGVSNTAILIATHTGTMNADITATASGEATFTINSDYTGSYQQTYDICQAAMAAYGGANGCIQHGHPTDGLIVAALVAGQAALDAELAAHQSALESAIIAQGPLTVTATIFNNGVYVDTFEIFDNLNPQFTASSDLGLVSVQNANVVYASTTGSNIISIDVEAGDYIEIIMNVGIVVSGIPTPVDLDNAKIAGFASGTVTLHSGSVTATMG